MISQQSLIPIHRDDTIAYHNLKSGIHLTSVPQSPVDKLQHKALQEQVHIHCLETQTSGGGFQEQKWAEIKVAQVKDSIQL